MSWPSSCLGLLTLSWELGKSTSYIKVTSSMIKALLFDLDLNIVWPYFDNITEGKENCTFNFCVDPLIYLFAPLQFVVPLDNLHMMVPPIFLITTL